jgi:hypothetical protein
MILSFKKEGEVWKYQMVSSWTPIEFRQLEPNPAITEEQYIFDMLEKLSGKKPTSEIWKPIN